MNLLNYAAGIQKIEIVRLIDNGELKEGDTIRILKGMTLYWDNPIKKVPDDPKYDEITLTKEVITKILEED